LLVPPPPSSPLFPYTTLFRSSHPCAPQGKERIDPTVPEGESGMGRDGKGGDRGDNRPLTPGGPVDGLHRRAAQRRLWRAERTPRSEEHTSELQSRSDLVCRLL